MITCPVYTSSGVITQHAHACSWNLGALGYTEELHQIQNEWARGSASKLDLITKTWDTTH